VGRSCSTPFELTSVILREAFSSSSGPLNPKPFQDGMSETHNYARGAIVGIGEGWASGQRAKEIFQTGQLSGQLLQVTSKIMFYLGVLPQ
jgi:hypothetical protein